MSSIHLISITCASCHTDTSVVCALGDKYQAEAAPSPASFLSTGKLPLAKQNKASLSPWSSGKGSQEEMMRLWFSHPPQLKTTLTSPDAECDHSCVLAKLSHDSLFTGISSMIITYNFVKVDFY